MFDLLSAVSSGTGMEWGWNKYKILTGTGGDACDFCPRAGLYYQRRRGPLCTTVRLCEFPWGPFQNDTSDELIQTRIIYSSYPVVARRPIQLLYV